MGPHLATPSTSSLSAEKESQTVSSKREENKDFENPFISSEKNHNSSSSVLNESHFRERSMDQIAGSSDKKLNKSPSLAA